MVIMISSLTRRSKRPRSGRLRVTWRMISSKHWEKSSSRTGQIPLSLAWRSISFWSSISLRRATSILEAGWWLTYWIQCLPVKIGGNDVSSRHKIQISGQLHYCWFDQVIESWRDSFKATDDFDRLIIWVLIRLFMMFITYHFQPILLEGEWHWECPPAWACSPSVAEFPSSWMLQSKEVNRSV